MPTSPAVKVKARTCVRTGCNTCKIRKVKCDERRPQCARCVSTGRTCDGYSEPPPIQRRKSTKYPPNLRILSTYRPQEHVLEDDTDYRCFAYFRCRVVQDISGCFEVDFWDSLVPQIGRAEPAVLHALLALSSLYESISADRIVPGSLDTKLAVKHYTKAVGLLASGLSSNSSPEVVLVSCLVFVWFEFIQSNLDAGLNHLQAGLQILKDMQHSESIQRVDASLPRVFTRLQVQARLHGSPTSSFNGNRLREQELSLQLLPSAFTSLCQARSCLDGILDPLFAFSRRLYHASLSPFEIYRGAPERERIALESTRVSFLHQLHAWYLAFQKMQVSPSQVIEHPKTNAGILLLELHYIFACKIAQTAFWASEMEYDDLTADYLRIISLAERLIHDAESGWVGTGMMYFDIGVIAPLYFVALKCREPILRREAIGLLRRAPEREGMWLRSTCVKSAQRKVRMEEEGHEDLLRRGEKLPECVRINHEQSREEVVQGTRVTVLRYKRGGVALERIVDANAAIGELL